MSCCLYFAHRCEFLFPISFSETFDSNLKFEDLWPDSLRMSRCPVFFCVSLRWILRVCCWSSAWCPPLATWRTTCGASLTCRETPAAGAIQFVRQGDTKMFKMGIGHAMCFMSVFVMFYDVLCCFTILTRWSMFRYNKYKDDTKRYTNCVVFAVALRGEVQSQLASQRYADGATPLHMAAMCLDMRMLSHVMLTFVAPPSWYVRKAAKFCSKTLCDDWWISIFIRFIQFSVITSEIPNVFLWNDKYATSCDHADGSSEGLEWKNHWDLCYVPVLISMLPPMQERFGPVLICVDGLICVHGC